MSTKYDCPACKNGKITVTFHGFPGDGPEPSVTEMDCIRCKGSAKVTKKVLDAINFEKNMWCECEEETESVYYHDGVHHEIRKHHWRCKSCDKVKQIG